MLQIRYSPGNHPPGAPPPGTVWSPGEVDISGSASDLRRVRERVVSFLQSTETVFAVGDADSNFDPHPYERAIPAMVIHRTFGPTKVSTDGSSVLCVEGATENILRFMSWFDVPEDSPSGWHRHFDCLDGSPHVAKDCLDVVVGVR